MKQRFYTFLYIQTLWISVFLMSACTTSHVGPDAAVVAALNERGPLMLSSTNPYLAANQFVMLQASLYPTIHGFLENRGIPEAIEVRKPVFGNETVKYFYPEAREYFEFEKSGNAWSINGPLGIPGATIAQIFRSRGRNMPAPVLDPNTITQYGVTPVPIRIEGSGPHIQSPYDGSQKLLPPKALGGKEATPNEEDPFIARLNQLNNTATNTPFKSKASHEEFDTTVQSSTQPEVSAREVLMKKIIKEQKNNSLIDAEYAANGDLLHTVESAKETLSLIAAWYTHEADMAEQLSRINDKSVKSLVPGEQIRIPSYMLRCKKQFKKASVDRILLPLEPQAAMP